MPTTPSWKAGSNSDSALGAALSSAGISCSSQACGLFVHAGFHLAPLAVDGVQRLRQLQRLRPGRR